MCCSHQVGSIRANRQHWNLISRAYQEEHDPQIGAAPRLWGMSAVPDARLDALGKVTTDPPDWGHHWPAEMLWITHKP